MNAKTYSQRIFVKGINKWYHNCMFIQTLNKLNQPTTWITSICMYGNMNYDKAIHLWCFIIRAKSLQRQYSDATNMVVIKRVHCTNQAWPFLTNFFYFFSFFLFSFSSKKPILWTGIFWHCKNLATMIIKWIVNLGQLICGHWPNLHLATIFTYFPWLIPIILYHIWWPSALGDQKLE